MILKFEITTLPLRSNVLSPLHSFLTCLIPIEILFSLIFRPNRPVFNLMIPYQLDTLQLTQEKEKSSVAQCATG